jgi:hypothetical protein
MPNHLLCFPFTYYRYQQETSAVSLGILPPFYFRSLVTEALFLEEVTLLPYPPIPLIKTTHTKELQQTPIEMGYQITTLLAFLVVPAFLAHTYYRWRSDFPKKLRGPDSLRFYMVDATDFSSLIAQAHSCAGNDLDARYQKEVGDCEFKWLREYGNVWRQHGCLGVSDSEHSIECPPLLT